MLVLERTYMCRFHCSSLRVQLIHFKDVLTLSWFHSSVTKEGILVCIDSTFATPINQKALALGADFVMNSATKYIAEHNNVVAGCISGSEKLISQMCNLHFIFGGTLSPSSAYLVLRGMKTLHLRQQNSTALRMTKILEAHPKVKRVYYLGLPNLDKRQMIGFGGVIEGDIMPPMIFVYSLIIPYITPSFGGVESEVTQLAIMSYCYFAQIPSHVDIPRSKSATHKINDNLVRFCLDLRTSKI
ncbi:Cystathionine gamma-synthase 1, chloroplastic, partial [Mucuna pruriens]